MVPRRRSQVCQTMDALGTALSYLDRMASCWWGCRQSTHIEERLVGKVASNARAALHLMRAGYYDEALGLIRQIGETANLLCYSYSLRSRMRGGRVHPRR